MIQFFSTAFNLPVPARNVKRIPLRNTMQHIMTSRDGRNLDVLLGGNPNASMALVCHHGTPSDASIWTGWNEDALEHNLRLVAISRPGYAHSQRKKGRSVSCVVADVEDVLDELGIDRFLTVGWSGGGPHALACAEGLPTRCIAASVLAGVGPHGEPDLDSMSDMGPENIEHKKIAIQGEEPLREWARINAAAWFTIADDELTDALGGLIPEIDAVALNEHGMAAVWASSIRRSLQNGIDGYIDDSLVFCKYWGFRPDDIKVPVTVWQGDLDLMVPFTHGQWLIKHIPQAKSQLELGHGHISLIVDKKQDIIKDLLAHLPASK